MRELVVYLKNRQPLIFFWTISKSGLKVLKFSLFSHIFVSIEKSEKSYITVSARYLYYFLIFKNSTHRQQFESPGILERKKEKYFHLANDKCPKAIEDDIESDYG